MVSGSSPPPRRRADRRGSSAIVPPRLHHGRADPDDRLPDVGLHARRRWAYLPGMASDLFRWCGRRRRASARRLPAGEESERIEVLQQRCPARAVLVAAEEIVDHDLPRPGDLAQTCARRTKARVPEGQIEQLESTKQRAARHLRVSRLPALGATHLAADVAQLFRQRQPPPAARRQIPGAASTSVAPTAQRAVRSRRVWPDRPRCVTDYRTMVAD
jgi:hypothetical protein